uniref:GAIN-B domain-containing protein n=1 Tax=Loxodonta africana TaxID=9785 RepID=G3TD36_LOXAF
MDHCAALLLCLCLVTFQSGTAEASWKLRSLLEEMEMVANPKTSLPAPEYIHNLEYNLLNSTFEGHNLTEQTSQATIQALAFKLGCDFSGLLLSGATMEKVPQAWASHAMQFPAELTREACQIHRKKLRLICVYFYTSFFFQDDTNSSLLNNCVLGAQLGHDHVDNLREPINISFWHHQSLEGQTLTCVFWKKGAGKHHWGAWSSEGCRTEQPSPAQVLCRCHLSYFAVLMLEWGGGVRAAEDPTTRAEEQGKGASPSFLLGPQSALGFSGG